MLIPVIIVVVILVIIVVFYNSLVGNRNKVRNSWGQIDIQLKRRFDLIPNLVEIVKGYDNHERSTFEGVTSARTKYLSSSTPEDMMNANGELTQVLGKLFAVAEAYPELKSNINFLELQEELSKTEDKIGYARQFYNDVVMEYNNVVQMFPSSIVARFCSFKEESSFNVDEDEKSAPQIKF
ncbi:LemA family protein [Clostridium estertheticum]|uniref:LemA family protein n=1 Tax=Clostridium estertheticum TaxID=238834 RepID=A0AA47EL60_9CLOT|nr:LemA family protein [Clostridium estertheticum]MBU3156755.1 LemA family protein [Clostridium estertheticum]MBU3175794.1 LemA family protein [Clostridium estertheticum]WAG62221.1 LemA family protein [Clostridium estertheticum]